MNKILTKWNLFYRNEIRTITTTISTQAMTYSARPLISNFNKYNFINIFAELDSINLR